MEHNPLDFDGMLDRVVAGEEELPDSLAVAIMLPPIDPTFNPEGNELADQIIQQRASLAQLRGLLNGMDWTQKIAVAQIACNQISIAGPVRLVQLQPLETSDYELQAAATLMRLLPPDTLAEIAIEILEEPRDHNE